MQVKMFLIICREQRGSRPNLPNAAALDSLRHNRGAFAVHSLSEFGANAGSVDELPPEPVLI